MFHMCVCRLAAPAFFLSCLMRRQFLFDTGNGLGRIQMFGTDIGTIHDGMTAIEFEGIVDGLQAFGRLSIAGILHPSIGLHQDGRSQVGIGIPPIGRTGRTATGTQDAFVHAIEFGSVLAGLQIFGLTGCFGHGRLQPRFNGFVLFVKIGHVRYQIFEHVHVRQGINFGTARRGGGTGGSVLFAAVLGIVDVAETGQGIGAIDVHGTGSTNAFATTASKGQRGILFIFNLEQGIQYHGTTVIQIDRIRTEIGLLMRTFRIPAIDFEILNTFGFGRCGGSSLRGQEGGPQHHGSTHSCTTLVGLPERRRQTTTTTNGTHRDDDDDDDDDEYDDCVSNHHTRLFYIRMVVATTPKGEENVSSCLVASAPEPQKRKEQMLCACARAGSSRDWRAGATSSMPSDPKGRINYPW